MSKIWHDILLVLVMAAVTACIRFAPFVVFRKSTPAAVTYLGKVLPYAVMGMLLVYCLKDVSFASAANWLPPLLGVAATAALHVWKRQMMLSIAGGTAIYMIFIRLL